MSTTVQGYTVSSSEMKRAKKANKKYKAKQLAKAAKGKRKNKKQAPSGATVAAAQSLPVADFDGGNGFADARVGTSDTPITLQNAAPAIVFNPFLDVPSLAGIVVAYISYAIQRGFYAQAENESDAFGAAIYMYNILASFAQGQVPSVERLPFWLLCLGRSLCPKNCRFQLGQATYRFNVNAGGIGVSSFPLGYTPFGYSWNVNVPDGGVIDLFPTSTGATSSDPAGSALAFNELCQFMASSCKSKAAKLVTLNDSTEWDSNTSAFAVVAQQEGLGYGCGGITFLAQLEVPIYTPLFSKFTGLQTGGGNTLNRNPNLAVMSSGDSLYLAGALSSMYPTKWWKAKRAPRFHPVDFLEFADVLAKWVSAVQQALVNGPLTEFIPTTNLIACPLSLQEMQLLLRNVIMQAFEQTQPSVQSLLPNQPATNTENVFVPFIASATTAPITVIDMQLPMPLIENIRALVARFPIASRVNKNDIQAYVPILGQYSNDVLVVTDYNFVQGDVTIPSFTPAAMVKVGVDAKGKRVESKIVETPISLIDGNSSGTFVFINDPGRLKQLAGFWNDWIKLSGVQSYSVQLGTFGTDYGIKALCSVAMTRHWITENLKQKKIEKEFVDVRSKRSTGKTLSPYNTRVALGDSSQGEVLASAYGQVLSTWILPVNQITVGDFESDFTLVQRWQAFNGEPYLVSDSSSFTGISIDDMHAIYASKMTKANLAQADDWTAFFNTMAETGRGGILSSLGGFLDEMIGI